MRFLLLILAAAALSGCVVMAPPASAPREPVDAGASDWPSPQVAVANFAQVVERVEPVAEQICREEQPGLNCDFQILVDRDPSAGVNAFHTLSATGQPLIIYTIGLIAEARNVEELAFVMGHEAGHHIARHLPLQQQRAAVGAEVFAEIARRTGGNPAAIGEAARVGSLVASRRFGQQAELEADALGTVIAYRAGYDPILGSAFFGRLPDPDGAFLSSHPPNGARVQIVRQTLDQLRSGRLAFLP